MNIGTQIDAAELAPLGTQTGSVTDHVFDALYDAVILTKLPPGAKVSEKDIAAQLNVSRQPVRDAFFRLSNLGFLSIRPQRATLITQISIRAVQDAVFTRTALESECLRVAMTKNHADLVTALIKNMELQRQTDPSDAASFHALDEAFHETICAHSGHNHVWSLIREQKGHLDRIRFLTLSPERRNSAIAEHQTLLDSIEQGNVDFADTQLRHHIGDVIHTLPNIIARVPMYFQLGEQIQL
jgi:DNA-binding GntR family transcriptional regulator